MPPDYREKINKKKVNIFYQYKVVIIWLTFKFQQRYTFEGWGYVLALSGRLERNNIILKKGLINIEDLL